MAQQATGTFEVTLSPRECRAPTLGRMALDKTFEGDLVASSKGEMLAAMTGVQTSAGYVALERVTGALRGRPGTFVLPHSGTMNRGVSQLAVGVVPDSATGELSGLQGSMTMEITAAVHACSFTCTLPSEEADA